MRERKLGHRNVRLTGQGRQPAFQINRMIRTALATRSLYNLCCQSSPHHSFGGNYFVSLSSPGKDGIDRTLTHQALNGTTCYRDIFSTQLSPNLVSTIDLMVGLPDSMNLRNQSLVTPCPCAPQGWIALPGGMAPVAGRGNLQQLADRLDPKCFPVPVDEISYFFLRRSSSAWAKNALANRSISLA